MKPIASSDGEPRIFVLGRNANGLSLDAARARPDDKWSANDKFMFCLQPQVSRDIDEHHALEHGMDADKE
jgi:hypothetical protein